MNSFGCRLKIWRKALGLTQTEFANQASIHPVQIRKYETEQSIPSAEILERIASTGVNLNWLITGLGQMSLVEQSENTNEIPDSLKPFQDRLNAIHGILADMDEHKRITAIDEIFIRVQEAQRLSELERIVNELRNDRQTGS